MIKEDHPNDKAKQKQISERVEEANKFEKIFLQQIVLV